MRVQVAPGLVIRDPITKQLVPPEGIDVPDGDLFWHRRLRDGDVLIVQPAAKAEPAAERRSDE